MLKRKQLAHLADSDISADPMFLSSPEPVLWIAANRRKLIDSEYFHEAAKALRCRYEPTVPVTINNSASLAARVGTATMSSLLFVPIIDNDKLVIYCVDPWRAADMIHSCALVDTSTRNMQTEIIMCPLAELRHAIEITIYEPTNSRAELYLDTYRPQYSSKRALRAKERWVIFAITLSTACGIVLQPHASFIIFFTFMNILYLVLNPFRAGMMLFGTRHKSPTIDMSQLSGLEDRLPVYTILVPLKHEVEIVPKLMQRLKQLDYPAEKLDIKLIVEVEDTETIRALKAEGIEDSTAPCDPCNAIFHLIKTPMGTVSTKPRQCNYGIQFARGQVTVIYDAEDLPEPLQLKKAYVTLISGQLNTLCVQAKLNFYNTKQNLLTRMFALEYGYWYDYMLPGLQAARIPIPLGGASNHFPTDALRKIGYWDAYNVTEDADLGWRLSRFGYKTVMMDSYTYEEANSHLWGWIKQRTRWQKGFILTTIVHLRHPIELYRQLGLYGSLASMVLFTTNYVLPLANPFLWIAFALWYIPPLFHSPPIGLPIDGTIRAIGEFNLLFGNGVYVAVHVFAAIKKRQWQLVPLALIMPVYWLLISFASYRALLQIFMKPYEWEKTTHGLALDTPEILDVPLADPYP